MRIIAEWCNFVDICFSKERRKRIAIDFNWSVLNVWLFHPNLKYCFYWFWPIPLDWIRFANIAHWWLWSCSLSSFFKANKICLLDAYATWSHARFLPHQSDVTLTTHTQKTHTHSYKQSYVLEMALGWSDILYRFYTSHIN